MASAPSVTVQHGGDGGAVKLTLEIKGTIFFWYPHCRLSGIVTHTETEKLIAVYGHQLVSESDYGEKKYVPGIHSHRSLGNLPSSSSIVQLSFVVADYSEGAPTVKVHSKF